MTVDQKKELESQLWGVANVLRGKMDASEYKDYILGLIFYKYLSEKLEKYVKDSVLNNTDCTFEEILSKKECKQYIEAARHACVEHLGYFLLPDQTFSYIVRKGKGEIEKEKDTFILEDLQQILTAIENTSAGTKSEENFKGLFDDLDLSSNKLGKTENKKNEIVVEILQKLDKINFLLDEHKSDVLGEAYEYLIGEFAAGAGKKGGEFFTPPEVSRLLARVVTGDKKKIRKAYDPTCGSGSLLIRLQEFANVGDFYGQELTHTTYNLARMNMILHDIDFDKFSIRQGDTLEDDQFQGLEADAIVANPPFSAKWIGDKSPALASDDRFTQYGKLAPSSKADYAFVTHMLSHLSEGGTMGIVLPHGALFRGGAEGTIRKYIIERQNYLDAVIGLPANLFYGTSIPACIMVFKKCRKEDGDILFIDASKEFEKVKNQNKLTQENIDKIFTTYKDRKEIEKYSHKATLKEIAENDYNLNIPRYVDTFEEEKPIDLDEVAKDIKSIDKDMTKTDKEIAKFCKELGIEKPF